MDKWRRRLAFFFGTLSVFFAGVALLRHWQNTDCSTTTSSKITNWNKNLENTARQIDRAVLVIRTDSNLSQKLESEISEKYLVVKLNPSAWPADTQVLNLILSDAAKKRGIPESTFKFAILSPRLTPILLSSKEIDSKELNSLLKNFAEGYYNNRNKIISISRKNITPQKIEKYSQYNSQTSDIFISNINAMKLRVFMHTPKSITIPTATLTENARLLAKILKINLHNRNATIALSSAMNHIYIRLMNEGNLEKELLLARALADAGQLTKNITINTKVEEILKKLSDLQRNDGLYSYKNKEPEMLTNILASSFILYASKLFENQNEILGLAQRNALTLAKILDKDGVLPALPASNQESQASALEYAELAKLFADLFETTKKEIYAHLCAKSLSQMNRYFSSPNSLWYLNSKNSALVRMNRPIILTDTKLPSHIGVAACAIMKMRKFDPNFAKHHFPSIKGLISYTNVIPKQFSENCASIKLAALERKPTFKDGTILQAF